MNSKIRVGLIYGGKSGEHDVSLQTALAVIQAFDHNKYEIHPIYISKQGGWKAGEALPGPVHQIASLTFSGLEDANTAGQTALTVSQPTPSTGLEAIFAGTVELNASKAPNLQGLDVVFPLLHGTFGEDGTIQGLLEMANIPYVGAGVLASAVGMDKIMMKKIFAQEGIPQCLYRHFTRTQWNKEQAFHLLEIETALGYPCFVKPANLGSSVGISKARNQEELIQAISFAFQYDRKVIVEEHVEAREIEVSVLGNDEPQASVPGEILPCNEFYDYKAKYIDGKSEMVIPAQISDELAEQLQQLAIRAFLAIDSSGLSRVDFFVRIADSTVLINEINTMPGFTPFSMYPLLWKESGKPYVQLLDDLIELAVQRHADKQQIQYAND
ncbi:MAG: D-alanine--D-alanine ligase [Paenibacillaceae bacterium]